MFSPKEDDAPLSNQNLQTDNSEHKATDNSERTDTNIQTDANNLSVNNVVDNKQCFTEQKEQGKNNLQNNKKNTKQKKNSKKKKKVNLWPLKAMIITLFLSAGVNIASEIALTNAQVWLTYIITLAIILIGVFFDMIGTAATACDIQPFLAMASRKVKGAKTAVKLTKSSDAVSSVCNDIVGDICGIVSGVCAATIVTTQVKGDFWLSVLVYAIISTITITLKAVGKGFAVKKANAIIFATAKVLSIFKKEG